MTPPAPDTPKRYPEHITPGVEPDDRGLACRRCGCRHFYVLYTRQAAGGRILRRRECRHCGLRLSTVERERRDPAGGP